MVQRPPRESIDSFRDRKWKENLAKQDEDITTLSTVPFVTVGANSETPNARTVAGSSNITANDSGPGVALSFDLTNTGVAAGTYTLATITVDAKGRAVAASSGSVTFPTIEPANVPVGSVGMFFGVTPPNGWLMLDGKTIGNATSGATARASADVLNLYEFLWNRTTDQEAAVSSGRGLTASADFAANKTLTLPALRLQLPAAIPSSLWMSFIICYLPGFNPDPPSVLHDLTDVTLAGPNDGELLEYNGLTDQWVNRSPDKSPVYTYSGGNLSRIDYPSGNYKLFTYSGSRLTQLEYFLAGRTVTKVFSYNLNGTLASISQAESYN